MFTLTRSFYEGHLSRLFSARVSLSNPTAHPSWLYSCHPNSAMPNVAEPRMTTGCSDLSHMEYRRNCAAYRAGVSLVLMVGRFFKGVA